MGQFLLLPTGRKERTKRWKSDGGRGVEIANSSKSVLNIHYANNLVCKRFAFYIERVNVGPLEEVADLWLVFSTKNMHKISWEGKRIRIISLWRHLSQQVIKAQRIIFPGGIFNREVKIGMGERVGTRNKPDTQKKTKERKRKGKKEKTWQTRARWKGRVLKEIQLPFHLLHLHPTVFVFPPSL